VGYLHIWVTVYPLLHTRPLPFTPRPTYLGIWLRFFGLFLGSTHICSSYTHTRFTHYSCPLVWLVGLHTHCLYSFTFYSPSHTLFTLWTTQDYLYSSLPWITVTCSCFGLFCTLDTFGCPLVYSPLHTLYFVPLVGYGLPYGWVTFGLPRLDSTPLGYSWLPGFPHMDLVGFGYGYTVALDCYGCPCLRCTYGLRCVVVIVC